jgi:glycosyltransferase involved in cell wall biosynthesis
MAASLSENASQLNTKRPCPRVSVGIPVFNGERFLAETLDSILAQTFKDFEIVISDNASTDRTEQICRSYGARDPRIRYYPNDTNRGAAWNHNRVFELARGEYFKWQSHDDLCSPEFLEACVSALDCDPRIVLCFTQTQIVDAEGRPVSKYRVPAMTRMDSRYPYQRFHGAICPDHWCFEVYGLGRTAVLLQTPLIASYTGSDRVLLADLALRGRFREIPAPLFFNRDHPTRSIKTHTIYTAAAWFDPKLKGKITCPHWRLLLEYGRTVARSRLDTWKRTCCYAQLFPWVGRYRRNLVVDLCLASMIMIQKAFRKARDWVSWLVHERAGILQGATSRSREEKVRRKA